MLTCQVPAQQQTCINLCPPVYDPDEDGSSNLCPLDPCDELAYEVPGAATCPSGMSCWRDLFSADPAGFGRCRRALSTFGRACGSELLLPGQSPSRCEAGTFCAARGECSLADDWAKLTGMTDEDPGVCLLPVREGRRCDSNLVSLGQTGADGETVTGCRPCEAGTACLTYAEAGLEGPGEERRCFRRCERPDGSEDNGRCACQTSTCTVAPEPALDVGTGQPIGQHFCTPCTPSGEIFDETMPCCDVDFSDPTEGVIRDFPHQDEVDMCCRPSGSSCVVGADPELCCPGTTCENGTCHPCARRGDDASQIACCPGYARVAPPGLPGVVVCEPCSAYGMRCGDDRLDAFDPEPGSEAFDSIVLQSGEVPWWQVSDGAGGDFIFATPFVERTSHSIAERHRAYLWDDSLSISSGVNSLGLQLAQNPPGAMLEIEPPLPDETTPAWRSARIYDIGSCSALVGWDVLTQFLGIAFNQSLADPANSEPLRPRRGSWLTVQPRLQSEPEHAALPSGPRRSLDEIDVAATYTSASTAGCNDVTLEITGTFAIRSLPGVIATRETEVVDDRIVGGVGCRISASERAYECTLPVLRDDGELTLREYRYTRQRGELDQQMQQVRCWVARDRYDCFEPSRSGVFANFRRPSYARPVQELIATRDWVLERREFDVNIPGCVAWGGLIKELGMRSLEATIDRGLVTVSGRISDLINRVWGGRFIQTFGVSRTAVPRCGPRADDPSRLDHYLCQQSYFRGGRRHLCEDLGASEYRCNGARIEVRRMLARPEGIELVLAEGPNDPQTALLRGRVGGTPGLIPPTGPGNPAGLTAMPNLCDPERGIVQLEDDSANPLEPFLPRGLGASSTLPLIFGGSPSAICSRSDARCDGICPDVGLECDRAALLGGLGTVANLPVPPDFSVCTFGECCGARGRLCCEGETCGPGLACSEGRCL